MLQVRQEGAHVEKTAGPTEKIAFEVDEEEPLSENGGLDLASIELNALEIGSVQASLESPRIRIGMDSCAAVIVFPKTVAENYSVRKTPGKEGKLLPDLGRKNGTSQTQRWVCSIRESVSGRYAESSDDCVGDERHWSRCVRSQER